MQLKLSREPNEKKLIKEKQKIAAIKTFPVKTHIGLIFLLKVFSSIQELGYGYSTDQRVK